MAVRYDEKPDKDGQKCDICGTVTRRNVLKLKAQLSTVLDSSTESTSWRHNRLHEICQTFSLECQWLSVLRCFKTYL